MYKKMYYRLFNIVTDALNENDIEKLKSVLRNGQIETEEMYISHGNIIDFPEKYFTKK